MSVNNLEGALRLIRKVLDYPCYGYTLREKDQIVYVGATAKPDNRAENHRSNGKRFDHLHIEQTFACWEDARDWEHTALVDCLKNRGYWPRYNVSRNG